MEIFKKIILIVIFSSLNLFPQDAANLKSRIDSLLLGKNFLEQTALAIEVYDLTSSVSLYSRNSKLLLRPASNMKLLTSAAGILFLKDYSFRTSLLYTGEIVNGSLLGDLYIRGGCDPGFTPVELDSLIISLKALGIKNISGNIYADVSFKDNKIWGKGWMWDDDPSSDAPYLSALNINLNSVTVYVTPSDSSDHPRVRTEPVSSYFTISNQALNAKGLNEQDSLMITRDWVNRTNNILVTGKINAEDTIERNAKLNVYDPVNYFLNLFSERLTLYQITFKGKLLISKAPAFAEELYVYPRALDSVLYAINKSSDNLTAEMVLYALAEKYFGQPASAENGLLMLDSLISLTGLNPAGYFLADGSGVSHYNLISAEVLISLLKYMYFQQPELHEKFFNSLAVAGKDGTLKKRMSGTMAEGKVHAKTGTLTGVSCLSGYIDSASGNQIAFSLMVQNFAGDAGYARYIQDELCRIISGY